MNNIKIVPMNADHLESLERLERICFSRPWSRKMLAEELENQCAAFLVAEDAVTDDVLGYAWMRAISPTWRCSRNSAAGASPGSCCRSFSTSLRPTIWPS